MGPRFLIQRSWTSRQRAVLLTMTALVLLLATQFLKVGQVRLTVRPSNLSRRAGLPILACLLIASGTVWLAVALLDPSMLTSSLSSPSASEQTPSTSRLNTKVYAQDSPTLPCRWSGKGLTIIPRSQLTRQRGRMLASSGDLQRRETQRSHIEGRCHA